VREIVPPGLASFLPLFPALKRWAKLGRPYGNGSLELVFHRIARKRVLTHTLKPAFLVAASDTAKVAEEKVVARTAVAPSG